jgi:hypothetical protein
MTFKTTKSRNHILAERGVFGPAGTFEKAVEAHCAELNAWYERDQAVKAQPELPKRPDFFDFAKEEDPASAFAAAGAAWAELRAKHLDPYPRPSAVVDVEASCRFDGEKFVPDYEVVNDDPTPEQVLRRKKDELIGKVKEAENAVIDKVRLPPGKQRLVNMVLAQINDADEKIAKDVLKNATEEEKANLNLADEIAQRRSPEHKKQIAEIEIRAKTIHLIELNAAMAMSDIEDLTIDNVDGYVIPSFEPEL